MADEHSVTRGAEIRSRSQSATSGPSRDFLPVCDNGGVGANWEKISGGALS
jgi:hypothetical protein